MPYEGNAAPQRPKRALIINSGRTSPHRTMRFDTMSIATSLHSSNVERNDVL